MAWPATLQSAYRVERHKSRQRGQTMKYVQAIRAARSDPKLVEELYQIARRENKTDEFTVDLRACYEESPDNILYAAWFYRLQRAPQGDQAQGRSVNWRLAVPLSVVLGLIYWLLASPGLAYPDSIPYLVLAWAPIVAVFIITFLAISAGSYPRRFWLLVISLVTVGAYVTLLTTLSDREQYRILMILHLPLIAWIGVGLSILGLGSDQEDRFAFLIKSGEIFVTGGLYLIAGVVFAGITLGMFEALGVSMPEVLMRLLLAGGFGLIPVLAVASIYDPHVSPKEQNFRQGLGKLISTLMRLLLPLTLLILIIYLVVIPFNFMEPFHNRQVLIVYNAMLFGIMALLIGVTPVLGDELSQKQQSALRQGILGVAILAGLVSLYALSAIVYRTILGGITINRLTVIGWNSINIGILTWLIYKQLKDGPTGWIDSLQVIFNRGAIGYIVWVIFLTIAIPWLF
jgi:hypothetical protein